MLHNIEEIISYKTDDDTIFEKKNDAIKHADWLIEKEELAKLVQQVTDLFQSSMDRYKNVEYEKGYEFEEDELEIDFWEKQSSTLSNAASNDVLIDSLEDLIKLIVTLMKEYHLEEIIKLIKNRDKK